MNSTVFFKNGINSICLLILATGITLAHLPLKLTLQQTSLMVLAMSAGVLAVLAFLNVFTRHTAWRNNHVMLDLLLGTLILYLVIQLIPVSKDILMFLSPMMESQWTSNAYGLTNSATLSADISSGIWFLIKFSGYVLTFILLKQLIITRRHIVLFAAFIFLIGIFQVCFDIGSKYYGLDYISAEQIDGHSYRLTGTFINSNNTAALINLSVSAGLALIVLFKHNYSVSKSAVWVFLSLIVLAGEFLLVYGSVKAGSAGGFLSLIAAISIIALLSMIAKISLKVFLGFVFFLAAVFVLVIFFGSREINPTQLTEQLTLSGRPVLWKNILSMWQDFPVFGIGGGAFEWTFPAYKSDALSPLRVFTAHNGYLHLFVELGIAGSSILVAFFIIYIKKMIAGLKSKSVDSHVLSALLIGILAFLIHEIVETNILIPAVAIVFFALLTISVSILDMMGSSDEIQ